MINRGNVQHDVFATSGAKRAFLVTLGEASVQFGWRASAFVIMRNHYHLALQTPEPNLVAGMHWLQSTFAIRLTRFHHQHGHVFQGRYKALLIEDAHALARVCDYIHLNPVHAGIVAAANVGNYRWSSLWRGSTPPLLGGFTAANGRTPWSGRPVAIPGPSIVFTWRKSRPTRMTIAQCAARTREVAPRNVGA